MIPLGEAVRSLYGAWRLAHMDETGVEHFNATPTGFWRSFWAAGLVLPLYLLLLAVRLATGHTGEAETPRFLAVELLAYAHGWLLFPVVMLTVARVFGRQAFYIRYIVAYNWAGALQNGIYIPLLILGVSGLVPPQVVTALGLGLLSILMAYTWFVTRVALVVPAGTAAAITALDFTLGVIVTVSANSLLH